MQNPIHNSPIHQLSNSPVKKVIHVVKASGVAGYENHLRDLLPALQAQAIQCHLALLHPADADLSEYVHHFRSNHVQVTLLSMHRHFDPAIIRQLRALIDKFKPDVVHLHGIHADLHGTLAARSSQTPVIQSRHNDDPFRRRFPINRLNQWLGNYASKVIAISHHLERFVVDIERISANKVQTIHYGLHPSETQPALTKQQFGLDPNRTTIGFVGRLIEQKGVSYLLQAFAKLCEEHDLQLLIVGDGNKAIELKAHAQKLGLTERIVWLGWQTNAAQFMHLMDIVMIPSQWEGFGLVALEAMNAQKPIIASRVSALPEIIQHQETGLLVAPGDVDSIANAMKRLMTTPDLQHTYGQAGFARLQTQFSVEKMATAHANLYREVA